MTYETIHASSLDGISIEMHSRYICMKAAELYLNAKLEAFSCPVLDNDK